MQRLNTIAYMLIQDQCMLAEKRKLTKKLCPGAIAIPGGHVEDGESVEDALKREIYEELGVVTDDFDFVCTLLDQSRKLNYFVIHSWQGEIHNYEAEALAWIPLDSLNQLDLDVDRVAVQEYLRVYRNNF